MFYVEGNAQKVNMLFMKEILANVLCGLFDILMYFELKQKDHCEFSWFYFSISCGNWATTDVTETFNYNWIEANLFHKDDFFPFVYSLQDIFFTDWV